MNFIFLLKYWPKINPVKEVLLLSELDEIVGLVSNECLESNRFKLISLLKSCIVNNHYQVAERSLFTFNNDRILKLLKDFKH